MLFFIGISFSLIILVKPAYCSGVFYSLFFSNIDAFGKGIIDSYSTELSDNPIFDSINT